MSNSVWPHRQQFTRLPHPWDSPSKNTRVGCHFLLQCMKVNSRHHATSPLKTSVSKTIWVFSFKKPNIFVPVNNFIFSNIECSVHIKNFLPFYNYFIQTKIKIRGTQFSPSAKLVQLLIPPVIKTLKHCWRFYLVDFSGCFLIVIQSLSHVWFCVTSWTAVHQTSLSFSGSQSLLKLTSTELVMLSNHLILCRPLLPSELWGRVIISDVGNSL